MRKNTESTLRMKLTWILTTVLVLVFFAGPVYAQSSSKLEAELEKNDKLLDQARQVVKESGSQLALEYYEKGMTLQQRAWDYFNDGNYHVSWIYANQARNHAEKAIATVRKGDEKTSLVEREIDRTDELLMQAREKFGSLTQSNLRLIYDNAQAAQNTARELYSGNRQRMALTATLRAREILNKGMESVQYAEEAQRELDKTDRLMDRAREMLAELDVSDYPPAFENAERLNQRAHELHKNGNNKQAVDNTLNARKIILEAIERIEGVIQKDNFPRVLKDLEHKHERIREQLTESPNQSADRYLERAREEMNKAQEAYNQSQIKQAMYHLRRANNFLTQSSEMIGF